MWTKDLASSLSVLEDMSGKKHPPATAHILKRLSASYCWTLDPRACSFSIQT